jgi:hypothetical protein
VDASKGREIHIATAQSTLHSVALGKRCASCLELIQVDRTALRQTPTDVAFQRASHVELSFAQLLVADILARRVGVAFLPQAAKLVHHLLAGEFPIWVEELCL